MLAFVNNVNSDFCRYTVNNPTGKKKEQDILPLVGIVHFKIHSQITAQFLLNFT